MKLEYALLLALIASVTVIAATHIGAELDAGFTFLSDKVSGGEVAVSAGQADSEV